MRVKRKRGERTSVKKRWGEVEEDEEVQSKDAGETEDLIWRRRRSCFYDDHDRDHDLGKRN